MMFPPEDLKAMYIKVTTEELEARLEQLKDKILESLKLND